MKRMNANIAGVFVLWIFVAITQGCKGDSSAANDLELLHLTDELSRLSITYSPHLKLVHKSIADTSGWSTLSRKSGYLTAQIKLPQSFQPKTNFSEAMVTVGWTDNLRAIQHCFDLPRRYIFKADTLQKGDEVFRYVQFGEAGAGNFYLTTQYRTRKWNRCYSIESVVHSTNIHNYPAESGVTAFDSLRVHNVLQSVIEGLSFRDK